MLAISAKPWRFGAPRAQKDEMAQTDVPDRLWRLKQIREECLHRKNDDPASITLNCAAQGWMAELSNSPRILGSGAERSWNG